MFWENLHPESILSDPVNLTRTLGACFCTVSHFFHSFIHAFVSKKVPSFRENSKYSPAYLLLGTRR